MEADGEKVSQGCSKKQENERNMREGQSTKKRQNKMRLRTNVPLPFI